MMLGRLLTCLILACALLFAQSTREDDRIYDQVRQKLTSDRDVRGGALEVDVKNGVVTLRGAVREEKQKTKAEKITKKVKGVTKVVNELTIRPYAP